MAELDPEKVQTKLAAARTRLILDKPFLGALVLRLPMVEADPQWCPTTGTDARSFYYNSEYIDSLTLAQTQFMLAHEALHCALSHFSRRHHRVLHRWNLACDYAINPLLVEDGLTPPYDTLIMDEYKGMTAEEIYPLLQEDDEQETIDEHLYDENSDGSGDGDQDGEPPPDHPPPQEQKEQERQQQPKNNAGENSDAGGQQQQNDNASDQTRPGASPQPPPLSPEERETLEVQWRQRMAGAAQQAIRAGKMDGAMARMIDHLLQPRLPWRMLLARYMTSAARDDYSYMRQSRRSQGNAILPALHSSQIDVVVAVDTSGSIRDREIQEFLSEISALKGQMRARVTLIPCDARIAEGAPWVFEPWEALSLQTDIHGGGGTDFRPVFDWVDEQALKPEILVYFSDLEGKFPELAPDYPVLWLVKGKEKPPWGQRVQLN
ncbi:vWA domain-containing protein [Thiolapillus sp.]